MKTPTQQVCLGDLNRQKGDDPEENVEELFRVVEHLQFIENYKKFTA